MLGSDNQSTLIKEPAKTFTSAPTKQAATSTITKSAGAGDSTKQKSSQKAAGGSDASKGRDGG